MVYLKKFTLLDEIQEHNIEFNEERRNIFNNYYPLHLFSSKSFKEINFDKITIFYGGNGSGKTTLINMISQKLNASRKSPIDKGSYFDLYVEHCDYEMSFEQPMEIKLITSDDVFDYLIDVRSINANVNRQKERLSKEYLDYKFNNNGNSFDNYDELKTSFYTNDDRRIIWQYKHLEYPIEKLNKKERQILESYLAEEEKGEHKVKTDSETFYQKHDYNKIKYNREKVEYIQEEEEIEEQPIGDEEEIKPIKSQLLKL